MKYFTCFLLMTVSVGAINLKSSSNIADCGPSINAINSCAQDANNVQVGAKICDAGQCNNLCKDHNDICDVNRYINRAKTTVINKKA